MTPGDLVIVACPACGLAHTSGEGGSGNSIGAVGWSDGYADAPMWHPPIFLVRCEGCAAVFWRGDAEEIDRIPYGGPGTRTVVVEDFGDEPAKVARAIRAERPEISLGQALKLAKGSAPRPVYRGAPWECEALEAALVGAGARVQPSGAAAWERAPQLHRVDAPRAILEALEAGVADGDEARERELRTEVWHGVNHFVRRGERVIPLPRSAIDANLSALAPLLRLEHPRERILRAEIARALRRWDEALALLEFRFSERLAPHAERVRALAKRRVAAVARLP